MIPKGSVIYLCGPITGMPNGNRTQFEKAERFYANREYVVLNPHHYADMAGNVPESVILRDEIASIACHVDAIALINGWEESKGSLVEIAVGLQSGIPFIKAFTFAHVYPNLNISAHGSQRSKSLAAQDDKPEANNGTKRPVPKKYHDLCQCN